jgi:hypothetical protein
MNAGVAERLSRADLRVPLQFDARPPAGSVADLRLPQHVARVMRVLVWYRPARFERHRIAIPALSESWLLQYNAAAGKRGDLL